MAGRKRSQRSTVSCSCHVGVDTYIDQTSTVTGLQVVQDRRLVQVSHVGHVLDLLELGWVHLLDVILLERLRLNKRM